MGSLFDKLWGSSKKAAEAGKALNEYRTGIIDRKTFLNEMGKLSQGEYTIFKEQLQEGAFGAGSVDFWNKQKLKPEVDDILGETEGGGIEPEEVEMPETPEFGDAESAVSPIILDLDKNGIKTTNKQGHYFDHDGNGFKESTGWVGSGDGLLVRDLNGDGVINNGTELFGNNTLLSNGQKAKNGFEALAELDENGDGVVDANDSGFSSLKVWIDANGDGITDTNELKTLSELGITSINTGYTNSNYVDENGNQHKQVGQITFDDGSTSSATDVWFDSKTAKRHEDDSIVVTDEVKLLPNATGFGHVHDLHQAMMLNPILAKMLNAIVAETDATKRSELLDAFIYQWTEVEDVISNSRGQYIDARQLSALEQLVGEDYLGTLCGGSHSKNPHGHAAYLLKAEYNKFKTFTEAQILAQTRYNLKGSIILSGFGSDVDDPSVDWQKLEQRLVALLDSGNSAEAKDIIKIIEGIGIYSANYTVDRRDFFLDLALTDNRFVPLLNDMYVVTNSTANNTHINLCNASYQHIKTIGLGGDYSPENVKAIRSGDHLIIQDKNSKALVTIDNYFIYDYSRGDTDKNKYQINNIIFNSGETWGFEKIKQQVIANAATDGNDTINGFNSQDDLIAGGKGNDIIYGGKGEDVYYFKEGDGNDIVYTGDHLKDTIWIDNIDKNTVTFSRQGNDLIIHYANNDTIKVVGHYANQSVKEVVVTNGNEYDTLLIDNNLLLAKDITFDKISIVKEGNNLLVIIDGQKPLLYKDYYAGNAVIGGFKLADGTIINPFNYGGAGDDSLTGTGTLVGGLGNDKLTITTKGSADTILFNLGDGQDYIVSYDQDKVVDKIVFGKDVTPDMISYHRNGNNLIIVVGDQGDQITIENYFYDAYRQTLNRFEFADGTVWQDIRSRGFNFVGTEANDNIQGFTYNDSLYGGAGNDTLYDIWGKNYLDGGAGNDSLTGTGTLVGGLGNDKLTITTKGSADTILFNLGDGQDYIVSYDQDKVADKIVFGKDVTPDMISYRRNGNNLIIVVGDQGDQITIENYFYDAYRQTLNRFEFADGTVWQDIRSRGFNFVGTEANDNIQGFTYNDSLYGGAGNDTLYDIWGKNYLDGGAGNDSLTGTGTLVGGLGNDKLTITTKGSADTILFNLGDGQDYIVSYDQDKVADKIVFGKDVTPDMISYRRNGNNLIIVVGDQGDQITIENYFYDAYRQTLNRFEFADGTVWQDIRSRGFNFVGTEANDNIQGFTYNDSLYGGAGNDTLYDIWGKNYLDGGAGNDSLTGTGTLVGGLGNDKLTITTKGSADTILFNLGDGQDYIVSYDQDKVADKIVFGKDVTPDMISYRRNGNNLIIVVGDQGDQITIENYFYDAYRQTLNRFEFADGTVWQDIRSRGFNFVGTEANDNIQGFTYNDSLYGGAGNDTLYDIWGKNYLDGGAGNDSLTGTGTLVGGLGNDKLTITTKGSADTILFNLGDGQDYIVSYDQDKVADKIVFGKDVTPDMISYRRNGNNLIIVVGDQGDQITIENYFYDAYRQTLNRFEFADGTVWQDIRSRGFNFVGTEANDNIQGFTYNDSLYGGAGNDTLYDIWGKNYLDGGAGNDSLTGTGTLVGGLGNDKLTITTKGSADTILFNLGDGQDYIVSYDQDKVADKIVFGKDVTPDMISYRRTGNNLIIVVGDQGDQITIENYFYDAYHQTLNRFEFADGTVWQDIRQTDKFNEIQYTIYGNASNNTLTGDARNNYLAGFAGDDILNAGAGNDVLEGGTGNDLLNGGEGQDTYFFSLGDGQDTINTGDDKLDIIKFRNVSSEMIAQVTREGDNLIFDYGQSDSITINNYFNGGAIGNIQFIDKNFTTEEFNQSFLQANLTNQVNKLLTVMANFSVTTGNCSAFTEDPQDRNNSLLAVSGL